jgi:hypothetical protein
LKFDNNYKLKSSDKIEAMSDNAMRPTAVLHRPKDQTEGAQLFMIGGRADRNSQKYNTKTDKWMVAPKLPLSHNITTNVCCNYRDEAIFTFIVDAKLTIKSAVLDLATATYTEPGTENAQEMDWAFTETMETHGIDRLHIKCAVTLPDGTIAVVGRGRPKNLAMQITGLVLIFAVNKNADGKFELKLQSQERIFPSIFCRQLDHLQSCGTNLIMVQDTPDEERFEAFAIDMSQMRKDGVNKLHMKHFFDKPEGEAN